ncbi:MAG: hypothetical protein ACYDG2_20655 [Ruminiclostridium sp.]
MSLFQTTTFGDYSGEKTERVDNLVSIMKKAGIPSTWSPNMDAWQKTHVALVTSLGNLLYQYDSNNYEVAKHYKDICTCIRGIKEGFAVVEALGFHITPCKMKLYSLPTPIVAFIMKIIFKTKFSEIAMAKHTISAREEMQCLQEEFNTLIKSSELETPNIDRLSTYLYK